MIGIYFFRVLACSSSFAICCCNCCLSAEILSRVSSTGCCTMVPSMMLPPHTGLAGPHPPPPCVPNWHTTDCSGHCCCTTGETKLHQHVCCDGHQHHGWVFSTVQIRSEQPQCENAGQIAACMLTPHPAPPPASSGRMVSGMTLIPRSLILGIELPPFRDRSRNCGIPSAWRS